MQVFVNVVFSCPEGAPARFMCSDQVPRAQEEGEGDAPTAKALSRRRRRINRHETVLQLRIKGKEEGGRSPFESDGSERGRE